MVERRRCLPVLGAHPGIHYLVASALVSDPSWGLIRGASRDAEYFIIGTLTSLSVAILAGLLLRALL
jgi:hypothetical protein